MTHEVLKPDAIQVQGNSETGEVHLFYRMPDGSSIALVLGQELLAKTISHISQAIVESPHEETRALAQLFAVRDIQAQLRHSTLITLRYEIEAGAVLEASFDREDAERLAEQLESALAGQQTSGSKTSH